MFELTRRHAIKLLGSAAALSFTASAKADWYMPSGHALFDRVTKTAKEFRENEADALLVGQYNELFKHRPSTRTIEQFAQVRFESLERHVRVHEPEPEPPRFIWNFTPEHVVLGFHVVRDDDPRADEQGTGFARVRDLSRMLGPLTRAVKEYREIQAANILNKATTYDPSVGGDGVPVCSTHHPCEDAVWSNRLDQPLSLESLKAVCWAIRNTFVDDANLRINARAKLLVVPIALTSEAERIRQAIAALESDDPNTPAIEGYIVSDYLTSARNWFVTTNIEGLVWFEREPYAITCEYDKDKDAVLVTGHEKRKFGCHDPRAVFGSFPQQA